MGKVAQVSNQIDQSIGRRLREKRVSEGLSEEQFARALDIDPDELRLFEQGLKRIRAEELLSISKALGVRPTYFFGFGQEERAAAGGDRERPYDAKGVYLSLPEQGLRLHRAFASVRNTRLREAIVTLVAEIAKGQMEMGPL